MEGDSHHQKTRASGVSDVGVLAWVSQVGRERAWRAGTSQTIAPSHPVSHPAALNQCLRLRSHLHPDLLPLRCPVGGLWWQNITISSFSTFASSSFEKLIVESFSSHGFGTCGDPTGVLSTEADERLFLCTKSCFLLFLLLPLRFTPPSRFVWPPGGRPTRLLFFFP